MDEVKEVVMTAGWMGFLRWAIIQPEFRAEFEKETGLKFVSLPPSPLEALIDRATGMDEVRGQTMLMKPQKPIIR